MRRRQILFALLGVLTLARMAWVLAHAPEPPVVPIVGPVDVDWSEALEEMREERESEQ